MMDSVKLLKVIDKTGNLKSLKRTGWKTFGIPSPESVADHSFRVAFISMLMADELKLDVSKLIQMSLIHDLAESITGDITPHCGISPEEKHRREENAFREIFDGLPNGDAYIHLWLEYEAQETPEAKVLKNIDKLEMAIQASEYEQIYPDMDLSEFIDDARKHIQNKTILRLFKTRINE